MGGITKTQIGVPVKILTGRRITIPQDIFEELNLKEGDWVLLESKDNRLYVHPAEVVPR